MGQVWSKADLDGIKEAGSKGGTGSVMAVTSQNWGPDGVQWTQDDLVTPLNQIPVDTTIDNSPGKNCNDTLDRVRGFTSFHSEGGYFVFGDGSVRLIANDIDLRTYRALSTIAGNEVVTVE